MVLRHYLFLICLVVVMSFRQPRLQQGNTQLNGKRHRAEPSRVESDRAETGPLHLKFVQCQDSGFFVCFIVRFIFNVWLL